MRIPGWMRRAAALSVMGLMAVVLFRYLAAISAADLLGAWNAIPGWALGLSLLCTAMSFACLAGYEWFSTHAVVPGRVDGDSALAVGWISHALSNTLGFHVLTGGAFRLHAYDAKGLGAGDIARVMGVVGACVAAGVASTSVVAVVGWRLQAGHPMQAFLIGSMALVGAWLAAWAVRSIRSSPRVDNQTALAVILLGLVEMASAIAALYVLLPSALAPSFPWFVLVFVGAMLLGIVSHAPGGIGVFEATMLAQWPDGEHAQVLAALLAYRMIYNLLPFALAVVVLGAGRARASLHVRRNRSNAQALRPDGG